MYPAAMTAVSQALFPFQANGSILEAGGKPVGSLLIGQPFSSARHFWSRPSMTEGFPYNAAASGGSNLGPGNPLLATQVAERVERLQGSGQGVSEPVPVDLVTASASGLDPHITPAAALYQVKRVAAARGLPETVVRELVLRHVEPRQWGVLGEMRVNVLRLNLALDKVR
jgi:K+-transporting ATPase ATPase C chain